MIKFFKDINNNLHEIDENYIALLPAGLTEITKLERDAIVNSPEKIKASNNAAIQLQIAELEAQIMPRMMRDYILRPNVPAKAGKTPAQFINDIDGQIAALRAQIQP